MQDCCFVAVSFAQAAAAASYLAGAASTPAGRDHRRAAAALVSLLVTHYPEQVSLADGGREAVREWVLVSFPLFPDVAPFRVEINALCAWSAAGVRAALREAAQAAVPPHASAAHPGAEMF